jgi:hypothetical protein
MSTANTIHYSTKDLNEAAFIWCQTGTKLVEVRPQSASGNNRAADTFYFRFDLQLTEEGLRQLRFDYTNSDTTVEPQLFVQKQTNLRDMLYTVKRNIR